MVGALFGILWWVVLLPFRLLHGVVDLLGRLTAVVLGFGMMVVGVALWAGPSLILGVPLFVIGLLITLRALD
jgi:hypothetical protein